MKVSGSNRQGVNEEQIPILLLSLSPSKRRRYLLPPLLPVLPPLLPVLPPGSAHRGGCMEGMHGVVEQTAKFRQSKSLQPADSSEGSERAEGLRKAVVCV